MSYHDLLMRHGKEADSGEERVFVYCQAPQKLTKTSEVVYRDQIAERDILHLEKLVEDLKDYRRALADRYSQLETMAYTDRLELERYPTSYSGIKFYVRIVRKYEDGTAENILHETYSGKERRAALNRFEELRKQRPGIEAVKDMERKRWER